MKKVLLCIVLLIISAHSTTINLNNNINIDARVISIDKDYLYLSSGAVLFVVEKEIIATIDNHDATTYLKQLSKQRSKKINYNSYIDIIEIDHHNQYKHGTYESIRQYFPDLNPVEPPFKQPVNPFSQKHNYLSIKPPRLLIRWFDGSYGYRLPKLNLEWRVSSSYISEYESQDSTFYSRFEDLRSLSTSIRYYQGKDCTGFFTGIGFTIAQLTANDLSYFFGFLKSEDRADFQIKGIIFETGITTIINGPLFLSWWGAFVAADADYECLNREKTGQKFLLLPSANLSIGYLF